MVFGLGLEELLYWENGKENGNYHSALGFQIKIMEKKMGN